MLMLMVIMMVIVVVIGMMTKWVLPCSLFLRVGTGDMGQPLLITDLYKIGTQNHELELILV
jgi:hypothetical protein